MPNPGHFAVNWSEEDNEYVGTHSGYPSMSWLDPLPEEALRGIRAAVREAEVDILSEQQEPASKCLVMPLPLPCCVFAFEESVRAYKEHLKTVSAEPCDRCGGKIQHGNFHAANPLALDAVSAPEEESAECVYCGEDYEYCRHDRVWAEEMVAEIERARKRKEEKWGSD
jgi:hypothetical protein